ncbi:TPA: hypothetical protein JF854_001493 [Enterobacter hormaechei subsp. steigerwaltii]|uniref:hypothetical protein n=1 Tax=Enterobacter hormaechei TaxID=158836 RepID=UPI000A620D6E|nr:hypothetical protein [Enterobacter hormaechei]HAS0712554.1 hypothetical protein [Enterobacter hormaechei subsp. steigerwaltii]HAS0890270.1 hypothetical protein [Enterobacter hormaechei subsp. steigerwaltii]HAS0898933.1 hypothetical protein [Enterobacter hormaechei subsp. steigerwaltii]HAT7679696.1 hypothetical protein [Enterobacter hormaechei subsp. steigerwaltii]HAV1001481.1 hypothetical protein [Enterobacter hormaechei subsp. steigerwaltii]
MSNEQAKSVFKPVLIALMIVGAFSLTACINSTVSINQVKTRYVVCNTQDYNPATASEDIKLCRLGLSTNK